MSNTDYEERRRQGDRCMPQVKAIAGQFFYRDDLTFEDQKHNTDLQVFVMGNDRLAVRNRNYYAYKNWKHEITIRFRRATGWPTEFDKIYYDHWGNYFFYGFMRPDGKLIIYWKICDLDVLRVYIGNQINLLGYDEFVRQHFRQNKDENDSDFLVFDTREIPGLVIMDSVHFGGWANPTNVCEHLDPEDYPICWTGVTA